MPSMRVRADWRLAIHAGLRHRRAPKKVSAGEKKETLGKKKGKKGRRCQVGQCRSGEENGSRRRWLAGPACSERERADGQRVRAMKAELASAVGRGADAGRALACGAGRRVGYAPG